MKRIVSLVGDFLMEPSNTNMLLLYRYQDTIANGDALYPHI